ncbi:MAG: hypothetical protein KatS3mg111_0960 [Pirellulaceae bacterium]|nr:MAG: hypothetical protein KatS3mg111_0960 [Pirellulaceae bacterium]
MMTFRRLVNYVGAEPFRPFRIKMTSGETFEIRHPEMIAIGRTTAHVFTWMNEDNEDPKEREREISILLIESIEPVKSQTTSDQSEN